LNDETIKELYQNSQGLCIPHLDVVIFLANQGVSSYLHETETVKIIALMEELQEFIRKSDYRFIGELTGAEGNAWIRTIEKVTGLYESQDVTTR
jgi:hypothetical protein